MCLGELLLKHSDNLSKTLQSSKMSASEGQVIAKMTEIPYNPFVLMTSLCCFGVVYIKRLLNWILPNLPRQRKIPRRYDYGSSSGNFPFSVEDYYKRIIIL